MPRTGAGEDRGARTRAAAAVAWAVAGVACAVPLVLAWPDPSLFDDDLIRVGALRRGHFPALLFRPFNEHLAPLFELASWLAWRAVGGRVESVAAAFQVAAYAAWGATLAALVALIRSELRSGPPALLAVAWLAVAPAGAETVLWYSASSFTWAAALALLAGLAASRATQSGAPARHRAWLAVAASAALASPLCCAMGVLAGPLAALRLLADAGEGRRGWRARLASAAAPALGTLAFGLVLAARPAHGPAVAASVRAHLHPAAAVWAALQAPAAVLAPTMLGGPSLVGAIPAGAAVAATVALLAALAAGAGAARGPRRGLLVTGLGWIGGGYLLAYLARAEPGDAWIFAVGRYHLFPEVGLACCLAAAVGPALDRLAGRRPLAAWGLVALLASAGAAVQGPRIVAMARDSFRHPDQPRAIAAAFRLERACAAEGVPLGQAIRIVGPARPPWFPRPLPFNPLLYLFDQRDGAERHPDADARARVLARLDADDRAAICGGLDADRDREPLAAGTTPPGIPLEPARLGADPAGPGRLWFAEFAIPPGHAVATVDVAGLAPGRAVEVWWAGPGQAWWVGRSVRWTTGPPAPLRLDRLPHWEVTAGPVAFRVVRRNRPLAPIGRPSLRITTAD